MANSLFQQLTQNQSLQNSMQQLQSIKQAANMIKGNSNPMQMLQVMSQQNPQMSEIINLVNSNGGNAKAVFLQKAKEMGIDPNSIINQLR